MTENTNKKINNIRNKTKKKRDKLVSSLTPEQRNIICKNSANTYNTFEDKIDELFKKNKMDIVSTSYNLEKQIISNLKKAVNPKNVQVRSLKEFIDLLKKNPGKFNYASAGNGSSHHLAGEQFKMLTKTFITHIPYRGAGPAMQDLIAGQVDIEFDGLGSSAAQIKNGSIVALAVASQKRAPGFPTVPTAAEAGLVGYEVSTWYGLFAPKGTPQPIIDKMTFEVQKAINTPDLKTIWTNNGSDTPNLSGDAFGKFVAGDIKRWAAVAKASGAKLD